MNSKKLIITNALIWAAMMIATAILVGGLMNEKHQLLVFLQIAGWYTMHNSLSKKK